MKLPYYAVIFTHLRTDVDEGYAELNSELEELAEKQPGFLGVENARNELGISISYWESMESIQSWRENLRHIHAKDKGRAIWYKWYKIRICRVEQENEFVK